eukprot:2846083-Amphidinium_carterae.1
MLACAKSKAAARPQRRSDHPGDESDDPPPPGEASDTGGKNRKGQKREHDLKLDPWEAVRKKNASMNTGRGPPAPPEGDDPGDDKSKRTWNKGIKTPSTEDTY